MNLLEELQDIKEDLDKVHTDGVKAHMAKYLNRAKNRLMAVIADGERREYQKNLTVTNPSSVRVYGESTTGQLGSNQERAET